MPIENDPLASYGQSGVEQTKRVAKVAVIAG
jgi:hypothetical protein